MSPLATAVTPPAERVKFEGGKLLYTKATKRHALNQCGSGACIHHRHNSGVFVCRPNEPLSVVDGREICSGELGMSLFLQPIPRAGSRSRVCAGAQLPHRHRLGHGAQGQRCHGQVNPSNLGSPPASLPKVPRSAPTAHCVVGGHAQRAHDSHADDEAGEDRSCSLGRLRLRVERGYG